MEILYISSVPSKKEFYWMKASVKQGVNITTYGMNEAGFKFHSLIQEGLKHYPSVNICSLVGRSTSAKTYKGLFWKAAKEFDGNIEYLHLGYINLPVIKQIGLGLSFFFKTLSWLIRNKRVHDKFIIADAAYITVIPFVSLARKFIRCKEVAIFCDIYAYMADVKDARDDVSFLHRFIGKFMKRVYRKLNAMVFLTEKMNEALNPLSKPYVIIEGLVDVGMENKENRFENKAAGCVVMYAGALREQYGLKNLIEGFTRYKNNDARLWVYGAGDYSESIKEAANRDSRILFFGQAELSEVINKELEATVLINPRPADREFTQYSFPSKNMEYMVSGTPVLTTRLPGMPLEYYDYVFTIDGNDSACITHALERVFSFTKEELHQKGAKTKTFVLENKNNIIQAQRIVDLISN